MQSVLVRQGKGEENGLEGRRVIQSLTEHKNPSQINSMRQTRPELATTTPYRITEFPRTTMHLPIKQIQEGIATTQATPLQQQPFINWNISYRPKVKEAPDLRATAGGKESVEL